MIKIQHRIFIAVLLIQGFSLKAQVSIPGDYFNRIDKTNDSSFLVLYQSIQKNYSNKKFEIIDLYSAVSFNSEYPRGYNDGAIWKGRGLTLEVHAGVRGKIGKLSYTFFPNVFYSQNNNFALAPQSNPSLNENNYQLSAGGGIDWVQRYGEEAFVSAHPGQSEIRLDFGHFNASVSTQNYSVGPSVFNPILLSRQAGGFPHLRLGLSPFDFKIRKMDTGKMEANIIMGLLAESEYFDQDTENDNRFFTGLFLGYSPAFAKEITVSFNKVLYKQTQYFEIQDVFSSLVILDDGVLDGDTLSVNDAFDQLASISLEWDLKNSDFRAWAEFAVNDFNGTSLKTLNEPEHSRAFTIGFSKYFNSKSNKKIGLTYEHTNLVRSTTYLYRPTPPYYSHGINLQGYTHNGQILGAGIGPGGNSDHLEISVFAQKKKYAFLVQRIESNKDYFLVNIQDTKRHDQEYSLGIIYQLTSDRMDYTFRGTIGRNINRYYEDDISNLFLSTSVRYKF